MKTTFWRLLKLALPLKGGMALAALLGVLTVASGVGLMVTSAWLISMAALHPSVAALSVAVVGVRFFGLARAVFRYLERYFSHQITFRLLARLRVWFYRSVEPLAPARLMEYKSGDLLSRVVNDIEILQNFYLRVIAPPLVAAVIGLALWFFLGAYNLVFAMVLLGFYLAAGIGVPVLTHLLSRKIGKEMVTLRAELNVQMVDGIQGMAELVAFGQEERHLAQVELLNRELGRLQQRFAWVSGLQGSLSNLLMNLASWTMLLVAIPLVRSGQLNGLYLAMLVLAVVSGFEAILPLPGAFQFLGGSLEAARRLFEIVDRGEAATAKNVKKAQAAPEEYSLEVKSLTFGYEAGTPVLKDLNFTLREGQTLALVGPSGAGKSTIASLLVGFWDYEQGQIRLGGQELRNYSQEQLCKVAAVVTQKTHLFNTTIKENLSIARPGATLEEIMEAAKQAQIHDFIESLPQGYNTRIGEQGLNLSGGERQRLALARAILKDAPLLILDEPTANLDPQTEREVLDAIHALSRTRTTIIITHRLVGLEKADEIIVLKEGKVAERGTERQLLEREGLYWRMWQAQNRRKPAALETAA